MQLPSPAEVAEVEAAEKHIAVPTIELEAKRRRTDGSNRVKYRCLRVQPRCGGKPELMLLCGVVKCGVVKCGAAKFEPQSSAAAVPDYTPTPRPF